MSGVETRDFSAPDETRSPDKTKVEIVNLADGQIGRYTFQPGWRWSECIKPVAGTDGCQVDHLGYVVSGRLHVVHEDGSETVSARARCTASHPAMTHGSSVTNPH